MLLETLKTEYKLQAILYAGLYYGQESMEVFRSEEMDIKDGHVKCEANQLLTFTTQIEEIPSMARLCFALHGKKKGAKVTFVNVL